MKTWLKTELHCHTVASDGDMTPSVLLERAQERGLFAIAVTDHNTVSACNRAVEEGGKRGIAVLRGIEWTTFWGHIVVTGGNCSTDWRSITPENVDACLRAARASGDLVTLAHPYRVGWPICAGCYNDFPLTAWDCVNAYEVMSHYNPHTYFATRKGIAQWEGLLRQDYRIAPVYGYDWHMIDYDPPVYASTYVFADPACGARGVMDAVKAGNTYCAVGLELEGGLSVGDRIVPFGGICEREKAQLRLRARKAERGEGAHEVVIQKLILSDAQSDRTLDWDGSAIEEDTIVTNKYLRVQIEGTADGDYGVLAVCAPWYAAYSEINEFNVRRNH